MAEAAGATTFFAPAERADARQVVAEHRLVQGNSLAAALLEAIPDLTLVLNRQRQIIAVNTPVLRALGIAEPSRLLGLRPGELVGCVHAGEGPGGCGTSESCAVCGAVAAVLESLETRGTCTRECRLRTSAEADGGAIDVAVQASYLAMEPIEVVVVVLRDVSAEKRRDVLERAFLHDVLNLTSGLQAILWLLDDPDEPNEAKTEYQRDLHSIVEQMTDEIRSHRELLAAERGELVASIDRLPVDEIVEAVAQAYRRHTVATGKRLTVAAPAGLWIETDPVLLRRVLGNLVKNAFEATSEGGTVSLSVESTGERGATFRVHNPGAMPLEVQQQVFQRSFSTKGGAGRGIGAHGARLLTERYLGGRIGFTSDSDCGTTFWVALP